MITSSLRGHKIELINKKWVYSDTKEPTSENWGTRPCGYCGKHNTTEGHDGCIGILEDVINACCGHGETDEAYVQFNNRSIIRGNQALNYIKQRKDV